jgi:glycosyltransferase involved in cell wall biosynthesis
MDCNPKITIITVTRNLIHAGRKVVFQKSVESVHNQSYENIEHIVIDGASTDGTLDLIKGYADKGWLTYYSEKDNGIYNAMNKGIDKSTGDFINFLNSDDFFNNTEGIKLSVKYLLETNADFSFAKCTFINSQEECLGIYNPVIESFLFRMPFCHQTMLIKKETIIRLDKFDENFNSAADFDFVLRLCLSGTNFIEVPLNFVSFRLAGISYLNQEQSISEYAKSCIKNLTKFAEFDFKTYQKMYSDLLLPKKLYESLINYLVHEYKIKFIDLIKNHSKTRGKFYKISKYTKLIDTPNAKVTLRKFLHPFLIFKKIISR